jgi:hypothetical protein
VLVAALAVVVPGWLARWLAEPDLRASFADKRRRLLAEKVDVAQWFVDFVEARAPLAPRRDARSPGRSTRAGARAEPERQGPIPS